MSALRSLLGGKRTYRGHRISVANDPKRGFGPDKLLRSASGLLSESLTYDDLFPLFCE